MLQNQTYYLLETIKNILNNELTPFVVDYVPINTTIETDWLTLIKSDTYNPDVFITFQQSFIDYCANGNNFLGLKNDTLAFSRIKASSLAIDIFFNSVCLPLLPIREVSIPLFNNEPMTGQVYVHSYKPYVSGSSNTIYWELRKRVSGLPLKRVLYDVNAGLFNKVGLLIQKETLGNFYSGSNTYSYEATAYLKVIDV